MITNCPNCAAPLDKHGYCSYCSTNVVPNLDVFRGNAFGYGSLIELNINVVDPWGNSMVIPLRGHIVNIECIVDDSYENNVNFIFEGRIRND